jgi:hypothetical protein
MPREDRRDAPGPRQADPWSRGAEEEPEPDWVAEIRSGRTARGERLKDVFAAFGGSGAADASRREGRDAVEGDPTEDDRPR